MEEGHKSRLSIHQGMTKMYQDLKQSFWWTRLQRWDSPRVGKVLLWTNIMVARILMSM